MTPDRFLLWLVSCVVVGAVVSGVSWVAMNLAFGYPLSFDVAFAMTVGGLLGLPLAIAAALVDGRQRPVWQVQGYAAAVALAAAVLITLMTHILFAGIPSIIVYLGMVASVSP